MTIGGTTPARNLIEVGGSIVHDMGRIQLFADMDLRLSTNRLSRTTTMACASSSSAPPFR
jgi:hypothetical protein